MYTIEELFLPRYHKTVKIWFEGARKHTSPDTIVQVSKDTLTELGEAVYSMVGARCDGGGGGYELPMKTELALYGMDQPCAP